MKDKVFGKRLRSLRKQRKLMQTEAAPLIGVSYSSLQNHEAGRLPSRTTLAKYLNFYCCDRDWLVTGKGLPFLEDRAGGHTAFGKPTTVPGKAQKPIEAITQDPLIEAITLLKEIVDYQDERITSILLSGLRSVQQLAQLGKEARSALNAAKRLQQDMEKEGFSIGGVRPVSQ